MALEGVLLPNSRSFVSAGLRRSVLSRNGAQVSDTLMITRV